MMGPPKIFHLTADSETHLLSHFKNVALTKQEQSFHLTEGKLCYTPEDSAAVRRGRSGISPGQGKSSSRTCWVTAESSRGDDEWLPLFTVQAQSLFCFKNVDPSIFSEPHFKLPGIK